MRNILFMLCLVALITGCSKDEDINPYSEKQQKALAIFHGTFADYQFSNLGESSLSHLQPDPDLIIFGEQYDQPLTLSVPDYMDGEKYQGEAHGVCTYKQIVIDTYNEVECYYKVSYDAQALTLYKKSDYSLWKYYSMLIESPTEFKLKSKNLTLPYIFKKQ